MKIGIIGAGRIGGNVATQAARNGHEVAVSFSRDPASLRAFARQLAGRASAVSPPEAVSWADVVVFAVPWGVIPAALGEAGPARRRLRGGVPAGGRPRGRRGRPRGRTDPAHPAVLEILAVAGADAAERARREQVRLAARG